MTGEPDAPSGRPAVFLDRDGTLVRDIAWGAEPAELELLPGVIEALGALRAAGFALVVASNQAGVARGYVSLAEAKASAAYLAALLAAAGLPLDGYYLSPYHDREGRVPSFSCPSPARKPGPAMLLAAAADLGLDLGRSWMIGDQPSDAQAGLAAGCRAILLDQGHLGWPAAAAIPAALRDPRTLLARNLPHAATLILAPPPPAVLGEGAGERGPAPRAGSGEPLYPLGPPLPPLVRATGGRPPARHSHQSTFMDDRGDRRSPLRPHPRTGDRRSPPPDRHPPPPPDPRAPGEPSPWPDAAWLARAAADGRRLAAWRRL